MDLGMIRNLQILTLHLETPDVSWGGREYVAYLFAHDVSSFGTNEDESIIKCGSYTGNGNNDGPEIDLGFEPQFLLIKMLLGIMLMESIGSYLTTCVA